MSRLQARPYHWYCLFGSHYPGSSRFYSHETGPKLGLFPMRGALAGLVLMWLAIGFVILSFGCGNNRLACRRCLRLLGGPWPCSGIPFQYFHLEGRIIFSSEYWG